MSKQRNPLEFAVREHQRILIPLLMLFTFTKVLADEDDPIEQYMLEHMFDSAGQDRGPGLIESIVQIKTSIIDLSSAIAEARQEFWSAYANGGRPFQDASKRLSKLLFEKDLWYFIKSFDEPQARVIGMLGGDCDGGIPASADHEFFEWVRAFEERCRANGPAYGPADFPIIMGKAFTESFSMYEPYRIARDWAELQAAPAPLPIEQYVVGLIQRFPAPKQDDATDREYKLLLKTFGKEQVLQAAKKIQSAVDKSGFISDPKSLGLFSAHLPAFNYGKTPDGRFIGFSDAKTPDVPKGAIILWGAENPYRALWALLTKDDPRLYLLNVIREYRTVSLQDVLNEWNGLVGKYGAEKIAHAADKIRKAPKSTSDGNLVDPLSIGVTTNLLYPAILELVVGRPMTVDDLRGSGFLSEKTAPITEKTVIEDTIGVTNRDAVPELARALYDQDIEALDEMFAKGKCLLAKKGATVIPLDFRLQDSSSNTLLVGYREKNEDALHRLILPMSAFEAGQSFIPNVKLAPTRHPERIKARRRPIHTPYIFPYVEHTSSLSSHQNVITTSTLEDLAEMMGGIDPKKILSPIVAYGPVPYMNGSLVEINFQIPDDPKTYTAVVQEGGSGMDYDEHYCELGEDLPTLKYGENFFTPPPTRIAYVPKSPAFIISPSKSIPGTELAPASTPASTPKPAPIVDAALLQSLRDVQKEFYTTWDKIVAHSGQFQTSDLRDLIRPFNEEYKVWVSKLPSLSGQALLKYEQDRLLYLKYLLKRLEYGGPLQTLEMPTPEPTSTPLSKSDWDERLQSVRERYETLWNTLPKSTRDAIQPDEQDFQNQLQKCSPDQRVALLVGRIRYLLTLQH